MSFRVCRGCFAHECIAQLTSLFEADSRNTEKLSIFGIDISSDQNVNDDALMCDECLKKLAEAFDFVEKVKKLDEKFFSARKSSKPRSSLPKVQPAAVQNATEQIIKTVDVVVDPTEVNKKENFAETWQMLKQRSGDDEKQASERISIKTSFQSRFKPSNNAVPCITAPETYLLPIPPREWAEFSKAQQTRGKKTTMTTVTFKYKGCISTGTTTKTFSQTTMTSIYR